MTEPSFLIAFGVGILSFLAPCTLPVLPGYFAYLAGASQEKDNRRKRLKILATSLAFVIGFLLVLVLLGATASIAGQFLLSNRRLWQKIGGALIMIFGLQTTGIVRWPRGFQAFWQRKPQAFLAGASFGLSWTPCIGPILGSILVLASQTQTLTQGISLLTSYALGLAIPMLLSGVFLSQFKFLRSQYISVISGVVLLTLGLLLFFDQYSQLTTKTAQVYRFLNIPIF